LEKKKEEWPISFLARYRADNECVIWKSGFGCLAGWDLSDDRNVVAHRRNCGKEALQGSWGAVVDVISGESVFFVAAFAFGEFGMGDSPQLRPAGSG
jgi:hypothetical protein